MHKLSRREFIYGAVVLATIPTELPAGQTVWHRVKRDRLFITVVKGEPSDWGWNTDSLHVAKGQQHASVKINCLDDLRDCNGLCASDEIADMLTRQLEFGGKVDPWYPTAEPQRSTAILRLSRPEKARIRQAIRNLRGPHSCVHEKCLVDYESMDHDLHGPLCRRLVYLNGAEYADPYVKTAHQQFERLRVCRYKIENRTVVDIEQAMYDDWRVVALDAYGTAVKTLAPRRAALDNTSL